MNKIRNKKGQFISDIEREIAILKTRIWFLEQKFEEIIKIKNRGRII